MMPYSSEADTSLVTVVAWAMYKVITWLNSSDESNPKFNKSPLEKSRVLFVLKIEHLIQPFNYCETLLNSKVTSRRRSLWQHAH